MTDTPLRYTRSWWRRSAHETPEAIADAGRSMASIELGDSAADAEVDPAFDDGGEPML